MMVSIDTELLFGEDVKVLNESKRSFSLQINNRQLQRPDKKKRC